MSIKIRFFGVMLAALAVVGCTKPNDNNNSNGNPDNDVVVTTYTPSDVTASTAVSGCSVQVRQGLSLTKIGVCWSTSANPTAADNQLSSEAWNEPFVKTLTGLSPNTTYHVRAFALRGLEYYYGEDKAFTTLADNGGGGGGGNGGGGTGNDINLPTVETAEVTHIKYNSARCGGNVTADGSSNVTARGICWSRHQGTTLDDNVVRIGSGLGEFSIHLQDLNPTTTYYVRAYATNSTGTNYGEEYSFVTKETPEPNPPAPTGAIDGIFSVSPTKQVWFSQGNLQYQASTGTWRFATNSYDYVGGMSGHNANTNSLGTVSGSSNNNVSPTYSGWIDLFGWGTSGWNNGNKYYQPYDWQSNENEGEIGYGYGPTDGINYDYDLTGTYSHADWGVHNAISNGGNQPGLWRTLTVDEWHYLFYEREASSVNGIDDARYTGVKITIGAKTINGQLLFPDEYVHPQGIELPHYINGLAGDITGNGYVVTQYTASDLRILQQAGCVFLPSCGLRYFDWSTQYYGDLYYGGSGGYWSASTSRYYTSSGVADYATAYYNHFNISNNEPLRLMKRFGLSVRLVQDCQ